MIERLYMSTQYVPMYETGSFRFIRHFDQTLLARIVGDYQALTAFEDEFLRQARREAVERSLTVLQAHPVKWHDIRAGERVLEVTFEVRHEPQANDQLVYDVYFKLARDPSLWQLGHTADPQKITRAAVEAVRDLGRLIATAPRPDDIPE
jgi:hypothetical protein